MSTLGFFPKDKFIEVSITGHSCPLNCPMCEGKWLKGMISISSPDELIRLGKRYWKEGARGILVSGGFTREGKLPIKPFIEALSELKSIGFLISAHTGVVGREEADLLSKAGVDVADYELILDEEAIRRSKALNLKPDDFLRGMELLIEGSIEVVPHLTVGLPGSSSDWVRRAADLIGELKVRRTVVLAFIPTHGTPLGGEVPPAPQAIKEAAKTLSKVSKVSLGCMRPPWLKRELDARVLSIVDRIANPHPNLRLRKVFACCSIPDEFIEQFLPDFT
ncbi:MAG: radical SAM protein [Candidatus Korarchaeota archaeon]|nr:radical SAM protein [Candidatus Korarchaeota archaeon]